MKKIVFLTLVASLTLPDGVYAAADMEEMLPQKSNYMCEKARLLSKKITVRSFKGLLCKQRAIAEWAESNCKGVDKYEHSKCHKNALAILKQAPKKGVTTKELAHDLRESAEQGELSAKEKAFFKQLMAGQ